jgi:SLT domain-containing protein/phage-related protein
VTILAFEVLRLEAILDMAGAQKARSDLSSVQKQSDSTAKSLEGMDNASTFSKLQTSLSKLSGSISDTQQQASKGVDVEARESGSSNVIQQLMGVQREVNNTDGQTANVSTNADTGSTLADLAKVGSAVRGVNGEKATVTVDANNQASPTIAAVNREQQSLSGQKATVTIDSDGGVETVGVLGMVTAAVNHLNGQKAKIDIDASSAAAVPSVLGDVTTNLNNMKSVAAVVSAATLPTLIAALGGAVGAAGALTAGAGALGVGLGAGLAAGATAAYGAVYGMVGGMQAANLAAQSAISNIFGAGKAFGSLAGETKFAEDQVKTFSDLVAQMPAGTDAAANASQRLALAQEYQAQTTQITIDWWGRYGAAANEAAASMLNLRLGMFEIISTAGGELIPVLTEWSNIALSQLPAVGTAFDVMTSSINYASDGIIALLQDSHTLENLGSIMAFVGGQAGSAFQILGYGAIGAINALTPMLGTMQNVTDYLIEMTESFAVWSSTATGAASIASAWGVLNGYGSQLWSTVTLLVGAMIQFGGALQQSGLVQQMVSGLQNMALQMNLLTNAGTSSRDALNGFLGNAGPILSAVGAAAGALVMELFRVVDATTSMQNAATGNLLLVDIFGAIQDAVTPLGDLLINTFQDLGPVLVDLIPNLAQLAAIFAGSTPQLVIFLGVINTLMTAFNALPDGMQTTIAQMVALGMVFSSVGGTSIIGLLSGVIQTRAALATLGLQGGLLSTIFGGIASAISYVVTAIGGATGIFGVFGAGIAGVAVTVTGIIAVLALLAGAAYLIYENWGSIAPVLGQIWETVYSTISGVIGSIVTLVQSVGQQIYDWWIQYTTQLGADQGVSWSEIATAVQTAMDAISAVVGYVAPYVVSLISSSWGTLSGIVGGIWTAISGVIQGSVSIILGIISVFTGLLTGNWTMAWTGLTTIASGVWAILAGVITGGLQIIMAIIQPFLTMITTLWTATWTALGPTVMTILTTIGTFISTVFTTIVTIITTILTTIGTTVMTVFTTIYTTVATILTSILTFIQTWGPTLLQVFVVAIALIVGVVAILLEPLVTAFITGFTMVYDTVSTIMTSIATLMQTIWAGIVAYVGPVITEIATAVQTGFDAVSTAISTAMDYIYNSIIVPTWQYISDTIYTTMDYIWNSVIVPIWDSISSAIMTSVDYIYNSVIVYYWDLISTYIYDTLSTIWNTYIVPIWQSISDAVYSAVDYIYNSIIVYYWDLISTYIYDTLNTIWNTYIVPIWQSISDAVYSAIDYIYNDVIVYYWDLISTKINDVLTSIQDAIQTAWDTITSNTEGFGSSFYDAVYNAFTTAVNKGLEIIATLLDGAGAALNEIGGAAAPFGEALTGAAETVRGYEFAEGGLAKGFAKGGLGTNNPNARMHIWNEQMGNEAYIAERGPRKANVGYLATAADWLDMMVVPKQNGHSKGLGYVDHHPAGRPIIRRYAAGGCSGDCGCGGSCGGSGGGAGGTRPRHEHGLFALGGMAFADGGTSTYSNRVTQPTYYSDTQNTGTAQGRGARLRVRPRQHRRSAGSTIGGGGGGGGFTRTAAGSGSSGYGATGGGGSGSTSNQFINKQFTKNTKGVSTSTRSGGGGSGTGRLTGAVTGGRSTGTSTTAAPGTTTTTSTTTTKQDRRAARQQRRADRRDRRAERRAAREAARWYEDIPIFNTSEMRFNNTFGYADGGLATPYLDMLAEGMPFSQFYCGGTNWDPDVAQIVSQISGRLGGASTPNTYEGHPGGETRSVDWWDAAGCPNNIAYETGNEIEGIVTSDFADQLTYYIWQGTIHGWGRADPYDDPSDQHFDHIHTTFNGASGGTGWACKAIKAIAQKGLDALMATAHAAMGLVDVPFIGGAGEEILDSGMQAVFDWIISQLPTCSGSGGGSGACFDALPDALKQMGLEGTAYETMMPQLIQCESGGDPNAVNDWDSNAAAGTPSIGCGQMIGPTFDKWQVAGCSDIRDPLCNLMASMNYQEGVYGEARGCGGYLVGGRIPGMGHRMIRAAGGERVLTRGQNQNFEALVNSLNNPRNVNPGTVAPAVAGSIAHSYQVTINQQFPDVKMGADMSPEEFSQLAFEGGYNGAAALFDDIGSRQQGHSARIAKGRS